MNNIDNRLRDAGIIASLMADIGPSRDQIVDRPHEEVCKSRVPHQHPQPTFVTWPTDKSLDEVVDNLVGSAQKENELIQVVVSHESGDFSSNGPLLSGAKKRKASLNIIPIITESFDEVKNIGDKAPATPVTFLPPLEVNTFTPGSSSRDKADGKRKYMPRKRGGSSGGNRKRGKQAITVNESEKQEAKGDLQHKGTTNAIKNLDNDLVDITVYESSERFMGEEAALTKPPPTP